MSNVVCVKVTNKMVSDVSASNFYFSGAIAEDADIVLSIGEVEACVNTNDLLAAINAVNAAKGGTW